MKKTVRSTVSYRPHSRRAAQALVEWVIVLAIIAVLCVMVVKQIHAYYQTAKRCAMRSTQ